MSFLELFLIAVGLAMDAFAVSICKGLSMPRLNWKHAVIVGLYFGLFQAGMPVLGYFLGSSFAGQIEALDHWIAFALLAVIGGNMIWESRKEDVQPNASVSLKVMLPLAIATSIDALAVGVTFGILQAELVLSVSLIGIVTFLLSLAGVKLGNCFGAKYKSRAELVGGLILVLLGLKILLEHMGVLAF